MRLERLVSLGLLAALTYSPELAFASPQIQSTTSIEDTIILSVGLFCPSLYVVSLLLAFRLKIRLLTRWVVLNLIVGHLLYLSIGLYAVVGRILVDSAILLESDLVIAQWVWNLVFCVGFYLMLAAPSALAVQLMILMSRLKKSKNVSPSLSNN